MPEMTQHQIENIIDKYKKGLPVKVGSLAEELGISVIATTELAENISGSFSKENGGYIIYVNASHPRSRQRFTIAHELGHFYKHRSSLESGEEILNPSKKEKSLHRPNHSSHLIDDPSDHKDFVRLVKETRKKNS
jgi:Zn-dependent peptidase ImmA (M78 family)